MVHDALNPLQPDHGSIRSLAHGVKILRELHGLEATRSLPQRKARIPAGSLVLYDTRMEAGAALGDLSLLMKGETLPAGTSWEGIPARIGEERKGNSLKG